MEHARLPSLPLEGGCSCGALRYRVHGDPLSLTACHCTSCQIGTGAAFAMSMLVLRKDFELCRGEPQSYEVTFPEDGRSKRKRFCTRCGAHVYTDMSKVPHVVNLKPGTLDVRDWLDPVAHIWLRSRQPWVAIPDGVLRYEQQPEDFAPVLQAWTARMGELRRRA